MTRYKKSDFIRWPLILAYDGFEYNCTPGAIPVPVPVPVVPNMVESTF